MVWQKQCEGLSFNCTSKGKMYGTRKLMAHFIVAVAQ